MKAGIFTRKWNCFIPGEDNNARTGGREGKMQAWFNRKLLDLREQVSFSHIFWLKQARAGPETTQFLRNTAVLVN
jgi:hypothetical protein